MNTDLRFGREFEEEKFSLKAYVLSKGESSHMWEVTPEGFEHGEDVIVTKTGRLGQVQCTSWDPKLETWRYCIARKDADDVSLYIPESQLIGAPAQTRLDTGKTILYAPRKLKHQRRAPRFRRDKGFNWFDYRSSDPLGKFLEKR